MILAMHILVMSDVVVTKDTQYILEDVRSVTEAPIVVTDALRTPRRQAELMIMSHNSGNNLLNLYGEKIRQYMPLIRAGDVDTLTAHFTGDNNISAHLVGRAIDIRSRGMSRKVKEEIFSLTKSGRYDVIEEYSPPHLHIELKDGQISISETWEDLIQW